MGAMTLRQDIEQIVAELDENPALGATAGSMLRFALAKDAPPVFTTVEELESEEAAKVLGLIAPDNTGLVVHWDRVNDKNIWVRPGVGGVCTSAELLENTDETYPGGFLIVPRPPAPNDPVPERAPLPALVTPCHGTPLWVSTRSEGCFGGYESTEVVDEISCDAPRCLNTWNPDGTVAYETPVV